ncbi:MAG: Sec-independent protein translocase protein TatB [Thermodesulfovibrionales bacterium]|nr:Sec-independent protein translocase protein TatB [Thermodesulfovibrionales bacterium]MDP3110694.1 Sec-independent protein translocase protein TatB [Thermodesulfovibrionales bacterium]
MLDIGIQELIVIFIVALLVFGPKRLPELGRTLGKAMTELKKAVSGVKEQMDSELYKLEQPASKAGSESSATRDELKNGSEPGKQNSKPGEG